MIEFGIVIYAVIYISSVCILGAVGLTIGFTLGMNKAFKIVKARYNLTEKESK